MPENKPFNPVEEFPLFEAGGAGDPDLRARLTMLCVKQTIPYMRDIVEHLGLKPEIVDIASFIKTDEDAQAAKEIGELYRRHGSDKATTHNYNLLYGCLAKGSNSNGILEIGIGSNNEEILSNMGAQHRPGGSLRAFRDFTTVNIFGADIDRDISIYEERIRTYYVDQTSPSSLETLGHALPNNLDLVIDDGLHAPNANLATLKFALNKVKPSGWVVIEDIGPAHVPIWQVMYAVISQSMECYLIKSKAAHMFAVRKNI